MLWPGPSFVPVISLAPGGRSISVSSRMQQAINDEQQTNVFALQAGSWIATQRMLNRMGMLFGERDTLLLEPLGAVFARASSFGRSPRIDYPVGPDRYFMPGSVSFAPEGNQFALATEEFTAAGLHQQLWVFDTAGVARTAQLGAVSGVWMRGVSTAWRPDSRMIVSAQIRLESPCGIGTNCFVGYESTIGRVSVTPAAVTESSRRIVLTGVATATTSVSVSDEGARVFTRISGPYLGDTHVDCSVNSVGLFTTDPLSVAFRLRPEPCGQRVP